MKFQIQLEKEDEEQQKCHKKPPCYLSRKPQKDFTFPKI